MTSVAGKLWGVTSLWTDHEGNSSLLTVQCRRAAAWDMTSASYVRIRNKNADLRNGGSTASLGEERREERGRNARLSALGNWAPLWQDPSRTVRTIDVVDFSTTVARVQMFSRADKLLCVICLPNFPELLALVAPRAAPNQSTFLFWSLFVGKREKEEGNP